MLPHVKYYGNRIATENLVPGEKVYGEKLVKINGKEYRIWDPRRSKLAAAILKGLKRVSLKESWKVLYLGAASGTTVSHLSDILRRGKIFAVEIAPRVFADLFFLSEKRKNIYPILADARQIWQYSGLVPVVDFVYQDIAQKDQTEIFLENCKAFLKKGGYGIIMIKARSIDVTKKPSKIFREERKKIEKEMEVLQILDLSPYEKDHACILVRC